MQSLVEHLIQILCQILTVSCICGYLNTIRRQNNKTTMALEIVIEKN